MQKLKKLFCCSDKKNPRTPKNQTQVSKEPSQKNVESLKNSHISSNSDDKQSTNESNIPSTIVNTISLNPSLLRTINAKEITQNPKKLIFQGEFYVQYHTLTKGKLYLVHFLQTEIEIRSLKTEKLFKSFKLDLNQQFYKSQKTFKSYPKNMKPQEVKERRFSTEIQIERQELDGFTINFTDLKQQISLYPKQKELFKKSKKYLENRLFRTNFTQDYKALKILGEGGFANIYLIQKRLSEKQKEEQKLQEKTSDNTIKSQGFFAAKVMSKKYLKEQNVDRSIIINEIELLFKAQSASVIKLYKVYEEETKFYLIFELCKGGNLQEYLEINNSTTFSKIQSIMRQLTDAFLVLKDQQIIHRDLKPENILLKKKDDLEELKLTDFGLGILKNQQLNMFAKVGTPGYIAPEIFNSEPSFVTYNEKCDVFSLGVIFHQLLLNTLPGNLAQSECNLLENNENFEIDFDDQKYEKIDSPIIMNLLKGMLQKIPRERYSIEQVSDHLFFKVKITDNKIENIPQSFRNRTYSVEKQEIDKSQERTRRRQLTLTPDHKKLMLQQINHNNTQEVQQYLSNQKSKLTQQLKEKQNLRKLQTNLKKIQIIQEKNQFLLNLKKQKNYQVNSQQLKELSDQQRKSLHLQSKLILNSIQNSQSPMNRGSIDGTPKNYNSYFSQQSEISIQNSCFSMNYDEQNDSYLENKSPKIYQRGSVSRERKSTFYKKNQHRNTLQPNQDQDNSYAKNNDLYTRNSYDYQQNTQTSTPESQCIDSANIKIPGLALMDPTYDSSENDSDDNSYNNMNQQMKHLPYLRHETKKDSIFKRVKEQTPLSYPEQIEQENDDNKSDISSNTSQK